MAEYKDNAAGVTTTTGTGGYVVSGGIDQYGPIIGALTNGSVYPYYIAFIDVADGAEYETGQGTWNSSTNTLARTTIETSSNGNVAVDWGVGQKVIYIVADSALSTDMANMVESSTKKILTSTERANIAASKLVTDLITVTQAVNLDTMEADIASMSAGMVYRGNWDASTGVFPGSGTAQVGDFYYCSVGGTVDAVVFTAGDNIVATTNNASISTFAGNWSQHDQTDAVQSVNAQTGTVVLDPDDLDDSLTTNKFATAEEKTKLGYITVTQAVDLDALEAGGSGGHVIQEDGVSQTTEPSLNFVEDFNLTDVAGVSTNVALSVANKASLALADTSVQTVNSATGPTVELDVYDIPQAVPEGDFDGVIKGWQDGSWVPISDSALPSSKWDVSEGVPTGTPTNTDSFKLDSTTGIFYAWKEGSAGVAGYSFNGTTQYATMPEWTTLGDPAIYSQVTYDYTGEDTGIIDDAPVSQFGRTGSGPYVYHAGNISNLRFTDTSPLQDTWTPSGTATLTTAIDVSNTEGKNGIISFDYRYATAAATTNILQGTSSNLLRIVSGVLTLDSTNGATGSLVVDGVPYAGFTGPALVDGQHYSIALETVAGDLKTIVLTAGCAMNNLLIEVQN